MSDDGGEDGGMPNGDEFGIDGGGVYTETEDENVCDRLGSACAGICIGVILFIVSFPLLFWNESRAVERYDALNEAESQVTSVTGFDVDPSKDGQLLHFSANITNGGDALVDPVFGIESDGLILRRYAEMYQWIEQESTSSSKKVGGGKTTTKSYTYEKEWKDYVIDSASFKQQSNERINPSYMEFASEAINADPILIGAYELPEDLVGRINWDKPLTVNVDNISDESIRSRAAQTSEGFYFSNNSTSDTTTPYTSIGDQRVSFTSTPASNITIVGVQNGNTISAFVSETGEGGDILLFKQGTHTATAMFDEAEAENAALTWILRLVGFIVMALGLYLVFRPVEVFADIIPCVGSIVGCGIIFMAVFISAILSSITISLAWLVAHPEIGAIFLAVTLSVVGCCAFGFKKLSDHRKDGNDDNDDSPEIVKPQSEPTVYAGGAAPPPPTVYASSEPPQSTAYANNYPPAVVPTVYANGQPPVYASAPTAMPTVYANDQPPAYGQPPVYASAPPPVYTSNAHQVPQGNVYVPNS